MNHVLDLGPQNKACPQPLNAERMASTPATGFYATPGAGTREVRIAYVLDVSDIKRAVACLAAGLEQYPGRC